MKCKYCYTEFDAKKYHYCPECGALLPESEKSVVVPVESQSTGWARAFRICDKCNKEYEMALQPGGNMIPYLIYNFGDCPHCGVRNDVWVKIVPNKTADSCGN